MNDVKRLLLIVIICFICIGCKDNKDKNKFQVEYEKYNDNYIKLDLSKGNIVEYSDLDKINSIIGNGSGVIFIGDAKDNLSRRVVDVLLSVADNTGLNKIYYYDSLDGINGIDSIENKKIPLVLFVFEGEVLDYHVGTIDDKVELSEDEVIELYNKYSLGVHKVLNDACDESC